MTYRRLLSTVGRTCILAMLVGPVSGTDLIPPASDIKKDRPRLLVRPEASPYAISLEELRSSSSRDAEFPPLLARLAGHRHAGAQALVWLMHGDRAAADRAITRMRAYRYPGGRVDTFHIFFRLTEFALAYDWLYDYAGFTADIRTELRSAITPLVQRGLQVIDDHMFHNYIWMSAGGLALWALATAGEDEESNLLFERLRQRFNRGLFPAWKYLDGLPSEPMGYWALYVFTPGVLTLLASQSAFEVDLVDEVRTHDGDWLERHFDNLVHSTLPDMRYLPWGDLQSGPNGGVTRDMAGIIDAMTWALRSPHGAYLSRWLKEKRGAARFAGETAIFYMLYTRNLKTKPRTPPLSFLAGNHTSGHFIARSGWDHGATVVALTSTDHFGDHHHFDQGSFIVYRNGLLAIDPPVYRRVRGPQQKTENHNTLLLDGKPQRPVRGQWFVTIEDFKRNLTSGRRLETGDILFHEATADWAAAACEFSRSYAPGVVETCVRQLLFVRPDTVLVVDHLRAPAGKSVPSVEWLLHLPEDATVGGKSVWATNGASWLRCRSVVPGGAPRTARVEEVRTERATFRYRGEEKLTLVHVLGVGDGNEPNRPPVEVEVERVAPDVQLLVRDRRFTFGGRAPFTVTSDNSKGSEESETGTK